MRLFRKILYWINIIGMVAYLIVCGFYLMTGKSLYHGQVGLMAQVASGLLLVSIPLIVEKMAHIALPDILVILYEIFILMAILLGTGMQAYSIPNWDKFEHLFSAGMLAGIGFMIYAARTPADKQNQIDPLLIALFGAAFGVMLGVCWEFYEFTGDSLFGMNMQRYMAAGKPLIGHPVLFDTMGDLLSDFVGSVGLSIYAFFKIRQNHQWLDTFKLRRIK